MSMKKIILLLLFVSSFSYSQDFGIYKVENYKIFPKENAKNNQWYSFEEGKTFYIKYYNITPIGIKNAVSDINEILRVNSLKFDSAFDSSFLSSIVKDIYDYEMLNITIGNESSEVKKSWYINRTETLTLLLKKDDYEISIYKP